MRLMEGVTMADDSVNRQSVTKLFLSGLPPDVEQETVVELLLEHDIVASEVDVKSGGTVYLDCADQSTADRAIDKLNGFKFQGSSLLVEPATNGTAMSDSGQESARRSCVLQISGLSSDLDLENFRNKLDTFGEVASVDRVEDGLLVTYGDEEQANRARSGLNGTSLEEHPSSIMTVEYVNSEEQPLAVAGDSSPATPETDGATPAIAQAESTTPSIPDEVANSEPKMNGDASLATDDDPDKLSASSPNPQGGQTSSGSASPSPTSGGAASQTSNQKKPSSRSGGGSKGNRFSGGGGSQGGNSGSQMGASSALRPSDFPLRMLVSGEMVGAIIGRQGTTIRQITQQTRARVDVHRKDNTGTHDKAITIYGNPENCTAACKKILEVMQEESRSMGRMVDGVDPSGEIPLRLLAHNNLIGRIIGKGGATIKKVMQDTDTKITVSSINELSPFNLERVITIKGSLEAVASAEALISTKLRQSYESDLQAMAPQAVMFPGGIHPMMMATLPGAVQGGPGGGPIRGGGHPSAGIYSQAAGLPGGPHFASAAGGFGPGGLAGPPGAPNQGVLSPVNQVQETAYLSIPNNSVGAVIGTKGSYIRNIIRVSGASVKIAPPQEGVEGSEAPPQGPYAERKVTIIGGPEAQWKAQGMIYEKLREEIFNSQTGRIPVEDPRLSVEIPVPSSQVGRIIGKGGSNVRELQRATGAVIKLPEQGVTPSAGNNDTLVHISGPFYSVQSAQRRIRTMVAPPQNLSGGGPPGGPLANPHVHVFAPQMQGSFAPHPQHQGPTAGGPHHPQSAQPHPSNLRMGPRGNGLQQPTPVHMNHAQPKPGGPYVVSHAAHNAM